VSSLLIDVLVAAATTSSAVPDAVALMTVLTLLATSKTLPLSWLPSAAATSLAEADGFCVVLEGSLASESARANTSGSPSLDVVDELRGTMSAAPEAPAVTTALATRARAVGDRPLNPDVLSSSQ
jgi:hypothetical protein